MKHIIPFIRIYINLTNKLNETIGQTVSWLALFMVLVTFSVVLLRYAFNIGWIAMQESITYMHVLLFMLGMAYTLKHDRHVRVDIFYQRCSPKNQAWIDVFGSLLLLLPVSCFIFWGSLEYVSDAWEIQESSRNSGGLPGVYLLKSCILIMAVLLILQAFALLFNNLLIALGYQDAEVKHG